MLKQIFSFICRLPLHFRGSRLCSCVFFVYFFWRGCPSLPFPSFRSCYCCNDRKSHALLYCQTVVAQGLQESHRQNLSCGTGLYLRCQFLNFVVDFSHYLSWTRNSHSYKVSALPPSDSPRSWLMVSFAKVLNFDVVSFFKFCLCCQYLSKKSLLN